MRRGRRASAGLVAVRDDQVVGFLTVVHHFEAVSEITWMAVHARHRGQGIGRALVRRLTGQLRDEGRRLLLVLTVSSLEEEPGVADGYQRTGVCSVGFLPARELPDLGPAGWLAIRGPAGASAGRRRRVRSPASP